MSFVQTASTFESLYAEGEMDYITPDYYELNKFDWYFPKLQFQSEYLPLGTSKPYCLHVDWIKKDQMSILDKYIAVQNMPNCWGATHSKVRWDESYPKSGLDFGLFKQLGREATSAD